MEMVAASRMKKAQERDLAARPYAEKMRLVLADLAAHPADEEKIPPLLKRRPVNKIAIVHITSDRGLCGALNANMNRRTASFILEQAKPAVLVTVGRKGRDFMARYGQKIVADFTGLGDKPGILDVGPIARIIIDDYSQEKVDMVYLAYPQFLSTLVQRPLIRQLLPVEPAALPLRENVEYIYEPDPQVVFFQLLPRFIEMQIYHALLEEAASEQSARMVSMRNATENAKEIIDGLTLTYNKARQELITTELLDIMGGVGAAT